MKITQDYVLMILNCEKYKYKALHQKKTWLKEIDLMYFHVIGDESMEKEFDFDFIENILKVKCPDDYISLPQKSYMALKAIHKKFNYKFVFKTDDDQNLTNPKFLNVVMNILNTKEDIHYGGKIINVPKSYLSQYHKIHPELPEFIPIHQTKYCTGRFYFLSQDAILYLLKQQCNIYKEYLEDYAIGFHLHSQYKINILLLDTEKYFKDNNI